MVQKKKSIRVEWLKMIKKTGFPIRALASLVASSEELLKEAERVNAAQGIVLSPDLARAASIHSNVQVVVMWVQGLDL